MKVAVFGLGYVGFTAACCIAREGHQVVGIDVSERKVAAINAGEPPIVEPVVREMLAEALAARPDHRPHRDRRRALDDADLAIVCVGTPSAADGSHNMGYIADVSRQIARALSGQRARDAADRGLPLDLPARHRRGADAADLRARFWASRCGARCELVYNPEFLREGTAVKDYFEPPKIVIGTARRPAQRGDGRR